MRITFLKLYAKRVKEELGLRATPSLEVAEAHAVDVMTNVSRALARKFVFGSYTHKDIVQEGIMFALEAIEQEKYDPSKPLRNFLYRHVQRRLINLRRNAFMRSEAPCTCCEPFDPPEEPCEAWQRWFELNQSKMCLANGSSGDEHDALGRIEVEDEDNSLELYLDENIPIGLRADYLRLKDGQKISHHKVLKVRDAVSALMEDG